MSWLFIEKDHSESYSKYRPTYPSSVYDLILDKLEQSFARLPHNKSCENGESRWKLAVDVGCGPGKGTTVLCHFFDEVVGVDSSESQILEAIKNIRRGPNNVSFVCYDATCLSQIFHELSVDLITVAQALHWFDRPKFYEECKRVLKPGGLFVAYGYGMHWFEDPKIEMMKRELFYPGVLKSSADAEILHLENHYEKIFPEFEKYFSSAERNDSLLMNFESSLEDYINYLSTLSFYKKFRHIYPDKEDPLLSIYRGFRKLYPHRSSLVKRKANIFVLFGRAA